MNCEVVDPDVSRILSMAPALNRFHRYLLVLTHARSYSTLFCHILGSHPQICGYNESKLAYEKITDFVKLNCLVHNAGNYRRESEYVLDKLIYDHFTVSDVVLSHARVMPIFILREPEAAITSHTRMILREHGEGLVNWGFAGSSPPFAMLTAAEFYCRRLVNLQTIRERLERLGNRGIFLASESLMDETGLAFQLVERTLSLREPLRETYQLFEKTGVCGGGDTSPMIRTGHIVRKRASDHERAVEIPPDVLDRARKLHNECRASFQASPAVVQLTY